jgi:aspartate carbamoyltransferase catalytic subunit
MSAQEVTDLIDLAIEIDANPQGYADRCKGKIMASLFYEPSTRTRLSFESAMLSLGGQVVGFASESSSSATKGESLADTIRVVSNYSDIAVIRHPKEGSALMASQFSLIPVINAGDGGHEHPTQTLTDLLTIYSVKGKLSELTIGFCGDLKFGRTVHSLIKALSRYADNRYVLVSPFELRPPDYIYTILRENKRKTVSDERLDDHMRDLDILYMTRVQRERFFNEEDYVRLKDSYILDTAKMRLAKPDMAVLHPLPRVNEIAPEVDKDPRAKYFEQVRYGKLIRMALIIKLLSAPVGRPIDAYDTQYR